MDTHIPDELLAAYVDGELEESERTRIEQAIAHDARLAQRVAQQRASRGRLRNVFDGVLREPLPKRLVNSARLEGPSAPAQVIDLARVRAERARRPERRKTPIPRRTLLTIAASALAGIGLGLLVEHLFDTAGPVEYRDGSLFASGTLNRLLSEQLASAGMSAGAAHVGISFRSKSGTYCRTFTFDTNHGLAGLACREAAGWRVLTLVGAEGAPQGGYRVAGSPLPVALLQAVEERINGTPLDVTAELKARRSGWH